MIDRVFQDLGLALGLGLLVGLQRERAESSLGGIRTFPLIALFGAVCALLSASAGGWVVAAGLIAVGALLVGANLEKARREDLREDSLGQTTEAAALLMYGIGAFVVLGDRAAAVVVGGAVAVLLQLKQPLHRFVGRLGETDVRAIMQFALIALVVFPVLPDRAFGPYQVINPREIWQVVLLIVGIGLAGYVAYKLFGERAGSLLAGVLGGMISSTATTVSSARRTKESPAAAPSAALVIMIASTIAVARVMIEIGAVAPSVTPEVIPPLAALFLLMGFLSAAASLRQTSRSAKMADQENPADLRSALVFGAVYAAVILAVAAAKDRFGTGALYVVALLSGLVDVDAVTLSTANLAGAGRIDAAAAWRLVLSAVLANLVFKSVLVFALGNRRLAWRIAGLFAVPIAAGIAILVLWPEGRWLAALI